MTAERGRGVMIRYSRLAWLILASVMILALTHLAMSPDPLADVDHSSVVPATGSVVVPASLEAP